MGTRRTVSAIIWSCASTKGDSRRGAGHADVRDSVAGPQLLQLEHREARASRGGIPVTRANRMHVLRHFFASALLDGGQSIRAVTEYLGHADPGFTLRTYTPDAVERGADAQGDRCRVRLRRRPCYEPRPPASSAGPHGPRPSRSAVGWAKASRRTDRPAFVQRACSPVRSSRGRRCRALGCRPWPDRGSGGRQRRPRWRTASPRWHRGRRRRRRWRSRCLRSQ